LIFTPKKQEARGDNVPGVVAKTRARAGVRQRTPRQSAKIR
jgi:hypothetical protein